MKPINQTDCNPPESLIEAVMFLRDIERLSHGDKHMERIQATYWARCLMTGSAMQHCEDRAPASGARDAWLMFNDTVRGKTHDYGEFTNEHWQGACKMRMEILKLHSIICDLVAVHGDNTEDDFPVLSRAREAIKESP